jgi:hypothetical protein
MPLATNSEALAEFGHNAGMDHPEQEWLLSDWDVWVHNPFYQGKPGRHPEEDPDHWDLPLTGREKLLRAAETVLIDSAMRAQDRAEREANIAAWEEADREWAEAMKVHRNPGCRCSDQQLTLVGCECMPW